MKVSLPQQRMTLYVVWRSDLTPMVFFSKKQAQDVWNDWLDEGEEARLDIYTLTGEQT